MPAYHIERSIRIDAPREKVLGLVNDFSEWPHWSPWLCMERSAKVDVYGTPGTNDHGYDWEGELVGAGGMKFNSVDGDTLNMDLHFLKPFKSTAGVRFDVKAVGDQTDVTWHMDGKMPFFLFFMIDGIKTYVGLDYERGLKMLKEYAETGSVKSKLTIEGVVDTPEMHYIGVNAQCTMDEIGDSMKTTLPAADELAKKSGIDITGPPAAIYHKTDLKNRDIEYSAVLPVKAATPIDGASCGTIPAGKAIKVTHVGSYHHLGNGWSAAMAEQRYRKHKLAKAIPSYEVYTSDPSETEEADIVTEIYIPVR